MGHDRQNAETLVARTSALGETQTTGKATQVSNDTHTQTLRGYHPSYGPLIEDLVKIKAAADQQTADQLVLAGVATFGARFRDADPPDNKRPDDWVYRILSNFDGAVHGDTAAHERLKHQDVSWLTNAAAQRVLSLASTPSRAPRIPNNDSPLLLTSTIPTTFKLKATEQKPKTETPGHLDEAIAIARAATKLPLPEEVHAAFEGLESVLELAKREDPHNGVVEGGHRLKVLGFVIAAIKAVVNAGNSEAARQVCERLEKLGHVVGFAGGALLAVDDLHRLIWGTTLTGKPITTNERFDAGVKVVALACGTTFGNAIALSVAGYVWVVNLVYPARDSYRDGSVEHLLGAKPEELKAQINALSEDPRYVMGTIDRLFRHTFHARSGPNATFSLSDAWDKYWRARVDVPDLDRVNLTAKDKPGSDVNGDRVQLAEDLKRIACAFVDVQVDDAHSKDR